tara:strand:- start:1715 stop:2293 length:579 start_codon:yes stop_codon:yes gene_type:complete
MKNIFNENHYTQCLQEDLRNDPTLRQSHKRRLYNEIKILNETDDKETGIISSEIKVYNLNEDVRSVYITALLMPMLHYNINVVFQFVNEYPFIQPTVVLQLKDTGETIYYKKMLYSESKMINDILFNQFKIRCLCCESVTCGEHWSPIRHFDFILNEVSEFLQIKSRLIEKLHALKVKQRYLIDDINIQEWL